MSELSITQINIPCGFIDLGMGDPSFSLLPLELIRQAAEVHFSTGDRRFLEYGIEQGNGYFRRSLADFLTKSYSFPVDPDLLFVTTGASSALDLLCTLNTRAGDVIFVEEPSYFLALRIFKEHGLRVISIPMDHNGLCLDALDEKLVEFNPKFVYIIPTFQNPSGMTLTLDRREKLVERAQRHDFLIVADEVYHFLAYTLTPPQTFATFTDNVEQVISVNSFSKILAPGLRLGWVQAHGKVIERLAGSGLLESGGGMTPFTSALIHYVIESGGLEENISRLRKEYSIRLNALDLALRQDLSMAKYMVPRGGFFFWVELPGVDTSHLRHKAKELNVGIRQGTLFSSVKGKANYMRLGFCFYDSDELREGVKRLRDCLEKNNFWQS